MRRTIALIGMIAAVTVQDLATAPAADHAAKIVYHHALAAKANPDCDWIGPGGRAVYRCRWNTENTFAGNAFTARRRPSTLAADPPAQRICDWVGPGGRAVYRCRVAD
jgi:hypothetical protein